MIVNGKKEDEGACFFKDRRAWGYLYATRGDTECEKWVKPRRSALWEGEVLGKGNGMAQNLEEIANNSKELSILYSK